MQISSHFTTITSPQTYLSKQKSDDFIDAHASMKFSEPVEGQLLPELTSFTNELYKNLQAQGRYEELANTFHFVTTARVIFQDRYNTDEVMPSDLPAILAILKEPYTLQAGTYLGQPETQEHFRARKNQAIENLSEFLAQKGLLASKDEPVSAPQKISVDMYYELKFKPKDDEELEKLLQELHNAREDLKKESLPVYQNATNEKSANSPLKDLLQSESVSQTKTLSNLDLSSENFFEDLANAYYKETGDMLESMEFMVVEKFLALAKRGMQALSTDDIAKGFEFGSKQWQETLKTAATNKALLNEMLAIAEREPILYSNNPRLDEHRARAKAFAKEVLALFDKSNLQI